MKDLKAISAAYERVDNHFEELQESFHDTEVQGRIKEEQRLNDQAYFILVWGQLETEIDGACKHAIDAGQSLDEWKARRAWDLIDSNNLSRLGFRERLKLVLDKNGKEYGEILKWHKLRNQIAHGQISSEGINVPQIIKDFNGIQELLE